MNTERRATGRMVRFVSAIFAVAMVVGAVYMFVLTPGTPDKKTLSEPQSGATEQHSP